MEELLAGIPSYLIGWSIFLLGVGIIMILFIRGLKIDKVAKEIEEIAHEDLRPKSATEIDMLIKKITTGKNLFKKKASMSIDPDGTILLKINKDPILKGGQQKIRISTGEDDMLLNRPLISYALRDNGIGAGYQFDMEVTVLPPENRKIYHEG